MIRAEMGGACQIVCTQPRRISAISLANRVADEQCQKLGELVGYKIRGESKVGPNTRLIFMTTGILLRMIQFDHLLKEVSHVIFDEVHERTVDGDLLLVLLKSLAEKRPDLKIILMSATVDARVFSSYFLGAPILTIPGFTHPVEDIYLETFVRNIGFTREDYLSSRTNRKSDQKADGDDEDTIDFKDPESYYSLFLKDVDKGRENINYTLITRLVQSICSDPESKEGAILIFLPGT